MESNSFASPGEKSDCTDVFYLFSRVNHACDSNVKQDFIEDFGAPAAMEILNKIPEVYRAAFANTGREA